MKTNKNSNNLLLSFIITIVIAGLITVDYWTYFQIKKTPILKRPTTQYTTKTEDPLAEWQTYSNDQYNFSFKYPPTSWTVINSTNTNLNDEIFGLSIQDSASENGDGLFIRIYKTTPLSDALTTYINGRYPPDIVTTLTVRREWDISGIKAKTYCGIPGMVPYCETLLPKGDYLYVVGQIEGNETTVYDQILSSFKFTDDISVWQTYTNNQYNFHLKYPSDWVAKEIPKQLYGGVVNFFQAGAETDPERGNIQPIGKNLITVSVLKNPNNLSLQQIFDNDYQNCLKKPDNDFGCPGATNTKSWQSITVDGAAAWRSGMSGIPEGPPADFLYIKQNGYFLNFTLMLFEPGSTDSYEAIFNQILSTFSFTKITTEIPTSWQTYVNDTYGFTISFPSNQYTTPEIRKTYIRIQNYVAFDQPRLKTDEYYIEIYANITTCDGAAADAHPATFGQRSGIIGLLPAGRDQGGAGMAACLPKPGQPISIQVTGGDSSLRLQERIISTLRF